MIFKSPTFQRRYDPVDDLGFQFVIIVAQIRKYTVMDLEETKLTDVSSFYLRILNKG